MAHHLAELMTRAETEPALKPQVFDAILKLWDHRAALSGQAYPLAKYQNAIRVLSHLMPSANPFRRFPADSDEYHLAAIFRSLSTLILDGVSILDGKHARSNDDACMMFLSEDERKILDFWKPDASNEINIQEILEGNLWLNRIINHKVDEKEKIIINIDIAVKSILLYKEKFQSK